MPIDFRLRSLQIKTFRGLKSLDMAFPEGAAGVLIGANNSCKSTILDAVSLALNGPSAYNFAPGKFDFFHDAAGKRTDSFEISVAFAAAKENLLPAVRGGIGDPIPVHGARVIGSVEKSERFSHEARLINKEGKPILLQRGVPLKGVAKETWKDHGISYSQRYARWSDISEHRPEVWLLRPGNLFVSLYQWKTGPLQRLAKLLASRFFASKWEFEYEQKKRAMPDTLRHAHRFFSEAVRAFPFWRDDLKPKMEATLSLYVGRQARMELAPSVQAIEDWLAEQLVLSFAADAGGAVTPLEKMGDGWQSLVRIAALDVLSQYPEEMASRVVLLFEEPESFLHPHLGRKLRGVLERLAEGGWTVILTTHSPNFVSFASKQSILRLTRNGEVVTARELRATEVDGAAKFQERIDERGSHEMLFAQRVLLCEGQDDVFALRSYLERRCGLDLDGKSISVIRAGDVNQLPAFAAMASKLGIPWCAVSDEDRLPDGSIKPNTQQARERLTKLQSAADAQQQWAVDLESCLGKTQGKADPAWQSTEIEPKADAALQHEHPDYFKACEAIRSWAMQ
jgi:putative ATP-dependent endonuclease of the OLD family